MNERIDIDALLAELGPEFDLDDDDSPWGSANLQSCGGACCAWADEAS